MATITIIVKADDQLEITTPDGQVERTVVYVSLNHEGKLVIAGGASIVGRIEGEDMKEKIL